MGRINVDGKDKCRWEVYMKMGRINVDGKCICRWEVYM